VSSESFKAMRQVNRLKIERDNQHDVDYHKSQWKPFPDKPERIHPQRQVILSEAKELFFGGSAGSSKTGLLVGLALTQHRNSLVLRRQGTQLKEVVRQLKDFAAPGWRWRGEGGDGGTLTTADGRTVECKGIKDEQDKEKFKGQPHDAKLWDEIADFTETQYEFVNIWNRTTLPNQRCRIVAAGNPPTRGGGEWVIRRWRAWLDPTAGKKAQSGDIRWYATIDSKEHEFPDNTPIKYKEYLIYPQSRTFISSRLSDNPRLMATDYASKLANLPEALKRAYLDGDFSVALQDDPWAVIPSSWIKAAFERWTANGGDNIPLTRAGLDIAYGGSDSTVLARRHGTWIAPFNSWRGEETDSGKKAAQLVLPILKGSKAPVNVDVIGYGAAAYEFLKENRVNVAGVNFGAGANNATDRRGILMFANMRALCYWNLRDMLDPELGDNLALPPDEDLLAELTAPKYEYRGGKIFIRSKEDISSELGRSPDKADAVALACYQPPVVPFMVESW
jgi:hypothetical protein